MGVPALGQARLEGSLTLPPALVSSGAASLVSPNAGKLVSPNGSAITGRVAAGLHTAAVALTTVANAHLDVERWEGGQWVPVGHVTTDVLGAYHLDGLPMGALYRLTATGNMRITARALVRLDETSVRPAASLAGSWSGFESPTRLMRAPLVVDLGTTFATVQVEAAAATDPKTYDAVTATGLHTFAQVMDEAVTPDVVTAIASGTPISTVLQQLDGTPAVGQAAQQATSPSPAPLASSAPSPAPGAPSPSPSPTPTPTPAPTPLPLAGIVTTVAGDGTQAELDAVNPTAARFNNPVGLAYDAAGTLWIGDWTGQTLRKWTAAGITTVRAYAGKKPEGLAFDGSGQLYATFQWDNSLHQVAPDGSLTTLAGDGNPGFVNGTGTGAEFSGPYRIAFGAGAVYLAEASNNAVRRITPAGGVTTWAGLGPASAGLVDGATASAKLNSPLAVAVDATGDVYVADYGNNVVRKITPAGMVSTLAGHADGSPGSADGAGSAAAFNGPAGIAVDSAGTVYVADYSNNTIRKVTPAGVVTTIAGDPTVGNAWADGTGSAAHFNQPINVVIAPDGSLIVADLGNNRLRKIR